MMDPHGIPGDTLVRYLLGELPDEEQREIEEAYFRAPDLLERLREIESDLLDDYARNRLPPAQKARLEARFLRTEHRQNEVQLRLAIAAAGRVPRAPLAGWSALPVVWRYGGIAAGVIAGVGILALTQQNRRLGFELRDLRTRVEQMAPTAEVAIVLRPGQDRAVSDSGLIVPSRAAWVRLRLDVGAAVFESYDARIEDPGGTARLTQSGLRPAGSSVEFGFPSAALPAGHYIVRLSGVRAGSPPRALPSYVFESR